MPRYALGPWVLSLEAGEPIGSAFAAVFAPLVRPESAPADFEIRLETMAWDATSPIRLPPEAEMIRWGSFKIHRAGEEYYLDFHETAFFRLSPGDGRAEGIFFLAPVQDRTLWIENVLLRVIALLLRQRGASLLHASGFATPEGAVLFVGANGTGKSTLALALAPPGGFLGDDLVLWDGARAWAFPKPARVGKFTAKLLGMAETAGEARADGKREIPAPPHAAGGHIPRAVYFPEILPRGARARGEAARVVPISPGEAERRILAAVEHTGRDDVFGPVESQVLRAAARGRLLAGEDPASWKAAITGGP